MAERIRGHADPDETGSIRDWTNYNHHRLEGRRNVLRWMIDNIGFRFLARVDHVEGIENFPMEGPAIVVINHIAFVDPVVVLAVLPRNVVPMAKIEVYRVPFFGIFPWLWQVIPVRRETIDRQALRKAIAVLEAGEVLLMAPEGTRSPSMGRAKEGLAFLAYRAGATIVPVAVDGTKGFPTLNRERLREPGAVIRIGKPFRFKPTTKRPDREQMRKMTDEAMYVVAGMLPEHRRGVYADLDHATTDTIEFLETPGE
ncbi:MAG TPA: 1-acyl-sn-glycerol-3-phosphate acyltransferase [Anaerolineae bacterium]|nr:1-acyl-sn-glycerol-3-phosphate acyltransferase [Anaerolineae bacterium]